MATPCVKGGMKLSEALDSMQLAYNPITKQLHFVSPKVNKKTPEPPDSSRSMIEATMDSSHFSKNDAAETATKNACEKIHGSVTVPKRGIEEKSDGKVSKKDSFSDDGNFSISTCEKSDTSDSPKSTLLWSGHKRGKDGGSFSSTVSSLSEYSLSGGYASRDEEEAAEEVRGGGDDGTKFKKKGLSGFFSRGVFPWKSSGSKAPEPASGVSWRLFGSKSSHNLVSAGEGGGGGEGGTVAPQPALAQPLPPTAASSGANTPLHRRQGSSASEKQFEDLVASSIALIQHDRPSNLPAKRSEEALRHRAEHARMVEAARRRGEREAAARRARHHESLRQEETLARHTREWTANILGNWENMKSSKRTLELWWSGLPPCVRGKVWQLAIENKLNVTLDMYHDCVARAKQKLQEAQLRRKRLKISNRDQDCKDCKPNGEAFEEKKGGEERTDLRDGNKKDETRSDMPCENGQVDKANEKPGINGCKNNTERLSYSHKKVVNEDEQSNYLGGNTDNQDRLTNQNHSEQDKSRLSPNLNGMHRNYSEQNLKCHCIDVAPSKKNSRSNPNLLDYGDECSMELIQLDIARTFPHLCIFQPGGPYFDVLHELLAAYVCYRPDIGYVQGMSFIGAMLILNMEAPQAFICFANLLDGPVLKAAFTRDGATMQRLWNAYTALLNHNLPSLAGRIAPELYLLEWLYTAFAKAMPLDAACRVWDVFLRDGDTFLFRSALGVLHMYQDTLKEMDFISAAQFLTKLPEELCADALFRSIAAVAMHASDGRAFEQLAESGEGEHVLEEGSAGAEGTAGEGL